MTVLKEIFIVWKTIVIICVPIIASPILNIDGSKEMACLYGVAVMAAFWITEALPLAVTAFLPVVLFPVLGVSPASTVATNYISDATMFSFSCLVFALVVEKWQLHRRIALGTLLLMGSSPKWLVMGFMLPTWFLSMWVNNTSATAMMLPVVMAVLGQLREQEISKQLRSVEQDTKVEVLTIKEHNTAGNTGKLKTKFDSQQYPSEEHKRMCKALSLCVAYAAGLGGIGSITGTSTNLIMQGQADAVFGAYGLQSGINFLTWIMCCFPTSALCLIVAWMWMVLHFFGIKELVKFDCGDKENTAATRNVVRAHLKKLGPLSFAEKAVIGHFIVLVLLWLTMEIPGGIGWRYFFKPGFVHNSTSGILIVLLLFIFPSERPQVFCFSNDKNENDISIPRSVPALLNWKLVHENFPWGTWFLVGGGYALARVCQESGLSLWIGTHLSVFAGMEPWVMVFVLSLIISFMTEITSNSASASIICPILAELAITLQMNPLYLLYPAVLSCSMAFILPVATAPNALVFATGHIKVKDMAKAGFVLNILCVLIINVSVNTWMSALLQLDHLPIEMQRSRNISSLYSEIVRDGINTTLHPL